MRIMPLKPSLIDRELLRLNRATNKTLANVSRGNPPVASVFEAWSDCPHRFFFFNYRDRTYVGQKLISTSMLELGHPVLFCSQIKAEMILGHLLRVQTSENGVEVYYEDIAHNDRAMLFEQLLNDQMIDLYFPYVPLTQADHKEYICSPTGWSVNPKLASFLFDSEFIQRTASIDLIKADGKHSPIIYDPACSTGDFLYAIKNAIPDAVVIGQELSQEMCLHAKQKIDQVTHGNAMSPCVPTDYCDYIFFRFLNTHVVSSNQAKALFEAIIPCLKKNGKAIIFGFTPVLIASPYLTKNGFRILSCTASAKEKKALIQYYVIERNI